MLYDVLISYTGYYQPSAGLELCDPCPAGYSCNTSHATICPIASVSELSQTECIQCAAGIELVNRMSLHASPFTSSETKEFSPLDSSTVEYQ